jgi:hypothetical protein
LLEVACDLDKEIQLNIEQKDKYSIVVDDNYVDENGNDSLSNKCRQHYLDEVKN